MANQRLASRRAISAALLIVGLLMLAFGSARADDEATVVVLPTTGVVDQIMSNYVREGIDAAVARGAPAVVIELDTPGGSLEATQEIVAAVLNSHVPVIVWVGPAGSRAASAGTFMTLASHVAAMAPATNIGAATPISGDGSDIPDDLGKKVLNDTVADITSIAEERGRPVDWAVSTVVEAESYTVDEALAAGAIDIKASSIDDLLSQADGMTVDLNGQATVLETAGAPAERLNMNPFQAFLHLLSDPNIAFILFTVGFYGIFFELQNPNYVTGILGAFALILAFIGFGSLPLNVAGLLLIGLAIILFVLELTVTSGGLLTIGGLVAFALGASALYTQPGDPVAPSVEVDYRVIALMTLLTGLFVVGVLYAAWKNRKTPPVNIGVGDLEKSPLPDGTHASVRRTLTPAGTIYAMGEEWTARSQDGTVLERGTAVKIVGHEGMTLLVARLTPEELAAKSSSGAGQSPTSSQQHVERTA